MRLKKPKKKDKKILRIGHGGRTTKVINPKKGGKYNRPKEKRDFRKGTN